jgi:SPP1 family predicted phage head-tail adaptor
MLAAGDLNRRVTVERYTATVDDQGGQVWSWEILADIWVKATPVASKEGLINGTLRTTQGWRIEMRRRDITNKDRLRATWLSGNQVLGIQSVADPDGRRESLVLFCETISGEE